MATDGILEAVKIVFDSSTAVKAAGFAELYSGRPPKLEKFPYATITSETANRIATTTELIIWAKPIQLAVYDRTEDLVDAHARLLQSLFPDSVKLVLASDGWTFKSMRLGDEDKEQEEDRVWRISIAATVTATQVRR